MDKERLLSAVRAAVNSLSTANPKFPVVREPIRISIANAKEVLTGIASTIVPTFVWENGYDGISQWLNDNNGRGIVLSGPCGTGKSLMASVVCIALNICFRKMPIMVTAAQMNKRCEELIEEKCGGIVYVDDIGRESESVVYGNRTVAFADIVDAVERNSGLLIASTNLSPDELTRKYGERTVDRLRSITVTVNLTGMSHR